MTFPAYRSCLESGADSVAIAAVADHHLIGLALIRLGPNEGKAARLLSLLVDQAHRRVGVGEALLQAARERLTCDVEEISVFWSSVLPSAEAFEALLRKTGWSDKSLDQCRVSGTAQGARDWAGRRLMDRMLTRNGRTFADHTEIADAERQEITQFVMARGAKPGWLPFEAIGGNQPVIPELSLIMRQHGEVAGWLTTCRADNGDIWYYRLHNIGAPKSAGALMPLIVEVNRRHLLLDGPNARWRWNTDEDRPDMLSFLARHAHEFCDFHDYHWRSRILLRSQSEHLVSQPGQV